MEDGGLDMLNIREFEMALKLTWIRKLIKDTPEWGEFAELFQINLLYQTDETFHQKILIKTRNEFWKSVIYAYTNWYKCLKRNHVVSADLTPLWGNPDIKLPFNAKMYTANIRYLNDLYKDGNVRLTMNELELKLGSKLSFLDYITIWKSIPKQLKDEMHSKHISYIVTIPQNVYYLIKNNKGTKNLRKIFKSDTYRILTSQKKWQTELILPHIPDWKLIYTMAKRCNLNAKIKYFNFQILHRSLITNKKLYTFHISDTELCENSGEVETIMHLLVECKLLQKLWLDLKRWMNKNLQERITLTKKVIIMGDSSKSILANYIIIITKYEIYKSKWTKKIIELKFILETLKKFLSIEEYISSSSNSSKKTLGKWSPIYNLLRKS